MGVNNGDTLLVLGATGTLGSALVKSARASKSFASIAACGFRRAPEGDINFQFDGCDPKAWVCLADQLAAKKVQLGAVVHCIGAARDGLLPQTSNEDWDEVLDLNLRTAFLATRTLLRIFTAQRRGQFIFAGSHAGSAGRAGQSNYAAAKAGLVGLAQTIAREYGKRNIRANVVLPGFLADSPMVSQMDPATLQQLQSENALGGPSNTEEVARFILHLLSMDRVSGQVFTLDSRIQPQH